MQYIASRLHFPSATHGHMCAAHCETATMQPSLGLTLSRHDDRVQVGVGGEGFFGAGNPLVTANPEFPAQMWPQQTGQVRTLYISKCKPESTSISSRDQLMRQFCSI